MIVDKYFTMKACIFLVLTTLAVYTASAAVPTTKAAAPKSASASPKVAAPKVAVSKPAAPKKVDDLTPILGDKTEQYRAISKIKSWKSRSKQMDAFLKTLTADQLKNLRKYEQETKNWVDIKNIVGDVAVKQMVNIYNTKKIKLAEKRAKITELLTKQAMAKVDAVNYILDVAHGVRKPSTLKPPGTKPQGTKPQGTKVNKGTATPAAAAAKKLV